jgi:hypothetical protein
MRASRDWAVAVALVAYGASAASAEVAIGHDGVGCVVAAQFPRFEARLLPADAVSRARLHFRPGGSPHWYSVAMKPEGEVFAGVLPKPKPSLKQIEYYIEVTDTAFGSSRTAEYRPEVASGPLACRDKATALALNAASVLIEGPAGAPLVPVGFDPAGVVAATPGGGSAPGSGATGGAGTPGATGAGTGSTASGAAGVSGGGGIGTTGLVIGGVAAAGAGIAIAVAGGGGDSGSTSSGGGTAGGGGGGTGGGGTSCTPGPVTASLANTQAAQRCGQRFAADVVLGNGSCGEVTVQSLQLTQSAVAGPFCSAAVTSTTYPSPVPAVAAGQTRTIFNFQSGVFCCQGSCPGATTCTYNETFVLQTSAGALQAGTLQLQVSFDPTCVPCS